MDEYWLKSYARAALEGMLANGQHDKEPASVTVAAVWEYAREMLRQGPFEAPRVDGSAFHECYKCGFRDVHEADMFCTHCGAQQPAF